MTIFTWIDLVYLIAAVGFILTLKGLSSPKFARRGNLLGAGAATLAIVMTFAIPSVRHAGGRLVLMVVAMVIGTAIAVPAARNVKMTAMPQMVAIFNGVGGGAAALISMTAFLVFTSRRNGEALPATYVIVEVVLGVLIGCVSFSGSAIAFAKLQELMTGRPVTYPGQQVINGIVGAAILSLAVATAVTASVPLLVVLAILSMALGVIFVLPIGGCEVPVLISLVNS
ncbi:MAG: NAD(P)(+) transhydrogenase (Re/Si-specific) subunit beta, partial [Acidimicrobiales bacterium]